MRVSENALLARARGHLLRRGAVLAALTLLMTLLYASMAWAQTFTVTNLKAAGPGSLRAAVNAAEARAGADEIVFADGVSGTVKLNWEYPLPMVTDPEGLVIKGGGDVTVSGNNAVQILRVGDGAALSLNSLTLSGGYQGFDDPQGGAISNVGGTVTVANSTISGNSALNGGGIFNTGGGAVTITNSTISHNGSGQMWFTGGGIYSENGTVKVSNSTISEHGSAGHPCCTSVGIFSGGILEVTNSTFSSNNGSAISNVGSGKVTNSTISGNSGSAIGNRGTLEVTSSTISGTTGSGIGNSGALEVTNSTFSDNRAVSWICEIDCEEVERPGGGIRNFGGTILVTNSTFSDNSASSGSAVFNGNDFNGNAGKTTLRNTIVANSTSGDNCGGEVPITDGGYNIDDASTCGFTQGTGSLSDTNPLLDPAGLADNGGPTLTIALLPESPAVDLVGQDACPPPSTDQRGVERPQGESCDSGAFELVQGPQTKADCKKGGWEEFGFKNEGQCIASLQREQAQTSQ